MKIFNRFTLIFLSFSFLALNGMEENELPRKDIAQAQKKRKLSICNYRARFKQQEQLSQPLNLMTQCLIKISKLMRIEKLAIENLNFLPIELKEKFELCDKLDIYFEQLVTKSNVKKIELIKQTKKLIYKFVESDSEHKKLFLEILQDFDGFFPFFEDDQWINQFEEEPFGIINLIVELLLSPHNVEGVIEMYTGFYSQIYGNRIMYLFAEECIMHYFPHFLQLILSLNLLSSEDSYPIIRYAFERSCIDEDMIPSISNAIGKAELESQFNKDDNILVSAVQEGSLTHVKLIFKLMQTLGISVWVYLNKAYGQKTLLSIALKEKDEEMIDFIRKNIGAS